VKRRPEWKQANPKMQLTAVLAAIEGTCSNLCHGVYGDTRLEDIYERLQDLFRQAHELNSTNSHSWDSFLALADPKPLSGI
jgi:hypothetical protein